MKIVDSNIAVLDILGFKDFIKRYESEKPQKITSLLKSLKSTEASINTDRFQEAFVSVISDTVVISCDKGAQDSIFQVIFSVSNITYDLLKAGLLYRGAITNGNIIHDTDNNIIVGTGFIKGYLMEESEAIYPRIILDPNIGNPAHSSIENPFCQEEYPMHARELFYKDFDGNMSLDTFTVLRHFSDFFVDNEEVSKICTLISTMMNSECPKIRSKGGYLAQYFGGYIRSYHPEESANLCLRISELPHI